jgi:hypothetical protein
VGVAIVALMLARQLPRNLWVYPLAGVALAHGLEHAYAYGHLLTSGVGASRGLLGTGGVIGLIPLPPVDLHNVYNGVELILLTLGLQYEIDTSSEGDATCA